MWKSRSIYIAIGMALGAAVVPRLASAQAPALNPTLAVPEKGAVIEQTRPVERAPTAPQAPAPNVAAPNEAVRAPGSEPAVVPAVVLDPATSGAAPAPGVTGSTASNAVLTGYIAGNSALTLDGVQAGALRSVSGGTATAEVALEKMGVDGLAKKHMAGVTYQDISFETDLGSKPLTDWIAASWKGNVVRKNGSVAGLDYASNERVLREFHDAVISETTFPDLQPVAPKQAAFITVTIAPEYTALKPGSGTRASGLSRGGVSGFRFEMPGLDGSKVTLIESFTVRHQRSEHTVGEQRLPSTPSAVEFPNLKLTMSESGAQSWAAWLDDFVVKGNNSEDKERDGNIVLLGTTGELGRVKLFHCGMVGLTATPGPQQAHFGQSISSASRRMTAELYCERMELAMN
ncbi:MAG: phage tail protein [Gemmatimonadales bacterium]